MAMAQVCGVVCGIAVAVTDLMIEKTEIFPGSAT
jgi:hypothetical protein